MRGLDVDVSLGHDVLEAVTVVVLQRRHHQLLPLPPRGLELEQRGRGGVPPLGQEHHEGERLEAVVQQPLEVGDHRVHQLLAERRVGLE